MENKSGTENLLAFLGVLSIIGAVIIAILTLNILSLFYGIIGGLLLVAVSNISYYQRLTYLSHKAEIQRREEKSSPESRREDLDQNSVYASRYSVPQNPTDEVRVASPGERSDTTQAESVGLSQVDQLLRDEEIKKGSDMVLRMYGKGAQERYLKEKLREAEEKKGAKF